jgi:hypothetical protein
VTTARDVLVAAYQANLVDALVNAFNEIESNFARGKWKASEMDASQFVEAARRILEIETGLAPTPIGKALPKFNDGSLKAYESGMNGTAHESFRVLIPRVLWAMYAIRNKRNVAHLGAEVSPNEIDAALILGQARWVMAELVRLKSGLTLEETARLVHELIEKETPLIWSDGAIERVLDTSLRLRDQVLVLLYARSPRSDQNLLAVTEASKRNMDRILGELHDDRCVEFNAGSCTLLPPGEREAEAVIHRTQKAMAAAS